MLCALHILTLPTHGNSMAQMPTALICGISGQDGAYLAQLLLAKGYRVVGTSRDAQATSFSRLATLKILGQVELTSMVISDFRSVLSTLDHFEPDEIYNLAGQSSVGLSFEQPVETLESISHGTLNLLECLRFLKRPYRLYNAGSSECFGNTGKSPANESTPFRPSSPYAVAKAGAYWQVANYRDAYGLYACSGVLFNHESPLRPERFVTQKIVRAAVRIASGAEERLKLGRLDIRRDWGWAPEYVDAMWRMLQQSTPRDYVIATGETNSLEILVSEAFSAVDLDWREHVEIDPTLMRPSDIPESHADPSAAHSALGWKACVPMREVIRRMVNAARDGRCTGFSMQ